MSKNYELFENSVCLTIMGIVSIFQICKTNVSDWLYLNKYINRRQNPRITRFTIKCI